TTAPATGRLDEDTQRSSRVSVPQPVGISSGQGTRGLRTGGPTVLDWFFARTSGGGDSTGGDGGEDRMIPSAPDETSSRQLSPEGNQREEQPLVLPDHILPSDVLPPAALDAIFAGPESVTSVDDTAEPPATVEGGAGPAVLALTLGWV